MFPMAFLIAIVALGAIGVWLASAGGQGQAGPPRRPPKE